MKKKYWLYLVSVSVSLVFGAGEKPTPPPPSGPLVPIDVVAKGRQGVVDYLLKQVDQVQIQTVGRSVLTSELQWITSVDLKNRGYIHPGSFWELQNALASVEFREEVIQLPGGGYDVNVKLAFFDKDGARILEGWGYVPINFAGVITDEIRPWIGLPETVLVKDYRIITAAKWMGKNWKDEPLPISYQNGYSTISIPQSLLGQGTLALASMTGQVSGWNFENGGFLPGKQIIALLGKLNSSEIRVLRNPEIIDAGDVQFYFSEGYIYGRFPLTELVLNEPLTTTVNFTIPVWGQDMRIAPAMLYITPISVNDDRSRLVPGQEYTLGAPGGSWTVPAGIYHLRIVFPNVLDWTADPNPKG